MLIKRAADIRSSEITSKSHYLNRRQFMAAAAAAGVGVVAGTNALLEAQSGVPAPHGKQLANVKKSPLSLTSEKINSWNEITTYNNYYEFGTDKDSPSKLAGRLKTEPWTVMLDGEVAKKGAMPLDEILKGEALEERVYRMRCVEAWSMVIPWVGFPLANLIKKVQPTAKAKYIAFETLNDPGQMPGLRIPTSGLDWPYKEGLRLDEANHPLTILAVGLYGEEMPRQNGAPLRLVVPWKYGFKGIKSIVKIRFQENQPRTAWNDSAPQEYGFYSNVNPMVDHPRWSQASERRIGEFLKRKTLPFNGYADQVQSLYAGMDLRKFY